MGRRGRKPLDLTGQMFGRLTVEESAENKRGGSLAWHCKCLCGNKTITAAHDLRRGTTKSCGCLAREASSRTMRELHRLQSLGLAKRPDATRHGMTQSVEYTACFDAKQRCINPDNKDYVRYGGRGIQFRFTTFEHFYAVLGPRPAGVDANGKALYSLDRIDNEGHYEPGNVRWASRSEQNRNQSDWEKRPRDAKTGRLLTTKAS